MMFLLVLVDHAGHVIDQLNDALGHVITVRGLAADEHAAFGPVTYREKTATSLPIKAEYT